MQLQEAREIARTLPCPVCKADPNVPCTFMFSMNRDEKVSMGKLMHFNRILQVKS